MAYLAPIHRPSSVRHAIKLDFLAQDSGDLVVAKANQLEIYSPHPEEADQLVLQHTKTLYGKVSLLEKLRPSKSVTDHLFVGTDRYHYFTLSWDAEKKDLVTGRKYHDVAEKGARDSQTGDRVHIDPTTRFLTLECHEGIVNVLPIAHANKGKRKITPEVHEVGELGDPIPVRIPELFVKSTCFLHNRREGSKLANPELAVLWEDTNHGSMRLRFRELEYERPLRPHEGPGSADMDKGRDARGEIELGASFLIPLPPPVYGCLVVGETSISYVEEWEERKLSSQPLAEATVWATWCAIDDARYALADDYGKLYLLFVEQGRGGEYVGHRLDVLGETSRANALVYLDGGRIFVGSHQGDSQVVQILERSLSVVQIFPNIAPILDFTVMDMGNRSSEATVNEFSSGQARIVTGSGAFKDGSLRSVRSGVGLEELLSEQGARRNTDAIFSLKSHGRAERDDTLVLCLYSSIEVYRVPAAREMEYVEGSFRGFEMAERTIHAANLPDGRAVQITRRAVVLTDAQDGTDSKKWKSPDTITAAAVEGTTVVVSLGGTALAVLDLSQGQIVVRRQRETGTDDQISCVALSRHTPGFCAVGYWKDSKVAFLSLATLDPVASTSVVEDDPIAVPRNLAIARLMTGQPQTLFVGLADGHVVTYSMESVAKPFTARKSVILGTQQPSFTLLPQADGSENVFVTSEHPSLVYGVDGQIVYSAVTADEVECLCAFDSAAYPGAVAICTSATELTIALVDPERTTHVQSLPIRETVRRIAYSAELKAFGLGTIQRTLKAGEEEVVSHFKLVDEVVFRQLHSYALNTDELIECVMRCQLDDGGGGTAERFVVGTAYLDDVQPGSGPQGKGRIIVFEVTESRQIKVVTELSLNGACRCLGVMHGRIVAALIKTVVVYELEYPSAHAKPTLTRKAAYRTATAPIDLVITGDTIAVLDLMKSLSLVEYRRSSDGTPDTLVEVARHFETLWGTAAAHVADDTYLVGDAEGNLVVLHRDVNGLTKDDRRRLRVTSEMLLGEMVNRIRRIDVTPTAAATVVPRAFLATVDGSIYMFGLIAPGKQDLLMRLQSRMAELIRSPGEVPFGRYRGFKTSVRDMSEEGPMRFVDGEIVERFLDLPEAVQTEVAGEVGGDQLDLDSLRAVVEGLGRLR